MPIQETQIQYAALKDFFLLVGKTGQEYRNKNNDNNKSNITSIIGTMKQ